MSDVVVPDKPMGDQEWVDTVLKLQHQWITELGTLQGEVRSLHLRVDQLEDAVRRLQEKRLSSGGASGGEGGAP